MRPYLQACVLVLPGGYGRGLECPRARGQGFNLGYSSLARSPPEALPGGGS